MKLVIAVNNYNKQIEKNWMTYCSGVCIIKNPVFCIVVSLSRDIFNISNSYSSSYQYGDSNKSDISNSCTSLGLATAIVVDALLFKQKAKTDS